MSTSQAGAPWLDLTSMSCRSRLVRVRVWVRVRGGGIGGFWRRYARASEAVAGRPVGWPLPGSAELPRAARRTLRSRRSRVGARPRKGAL